MKTSNRSAAEICADVSELGQRYSAPKGIATRGGTLSHESIVGALNEFMESVRYLNTRRSDGTVLRLDTEADVQDAVYLMLRPWVHDLTPEDPNGRVGNRYTIKDFLSRTLRTVVEAKIIRDKDHGKSISKEMHDDIESYRHHPDCDHLVFFVYDPNTFIPDAESLRRSIHSERLYDGKRLNVMLIIKP